LSFWKEIANYVGKGVRTVQRWEQDHGFPVRRPAADRGTVIARTAEIDAWIVGNQVIAMPAEIDAWLTENQDSTSDGEARPEELEEELVNSRVENAELRQQIAELRAELNELDAQLNELRKTS
jgi:septal ring factor EnvC (AmiA/AmiB activator)